MEKKRIFVGGLFPGVSEAELSAKFGHFGRVSNVSIVRKTDHEGNVVKTFSYIDMECPKGNYDRCVNIFDKSKWKGGQLSIQIAKESFLDRLSKERSDVSTEAPKAEVHETDSSISPVGKGGYETLANKARSTKNTPGTKVPGATKWVVGKYGVVLPVVQIREPNGRKVLKHDPSLHCHRIKRFKEDEDKGRGVSVMDLDWELQEDTSRKIPVEPSNEKIQEKATIGHKNEGESVKEGKRNKQGDQKKKKEGKQKEDHGVERYGNIRKIGMEEMVFDDMPLNDKKEKKKLMQKHTNARSEQVGSGRLGLSIVELIKIRSSVALQKEKDKVFNESSGNGTVINGSSLRLVKASSSESEGEEMLVHSPCDFKEEEKETKKRRRISNDTSNTTAITEGKGTKNDKQHGNNTGAKKQKVRTDEASGSKVTVTSCSQINGYLSGSSNHHSLLKAPEIEENVAKEKALESEQKRSMSVGRLHSARAKMQHMIKTSLHNLDKPVKSNQHITFGDDEDEIKEAEKDGVICNKVMKNQDKDSAVDKASSSLQKISSSASLSWLGLDEAENNEADDGIEDAEDLLPLKPQFEGEKGHKLFKLQQAIGADDRFTLSEKFLESDSDDDALETMETKHVDKEASTGAKDDGDVDLELREERERSLRILQGVIGGQVTASSSEAKSSRKNLGLVRFDPTDDSHREFEVKVKSAVQEGSSQDADETSPDEIQDSTEQKENEPEVSKDRYYDVSTSLKDLFSKKEPSGFSFLGESDVKETSPAHDQLPVMRSSSGTSENDSSRPDWAEDLFGHKDYADDVNMLSTAGNDGNQIKQKTRFFFAIDDSRLQTNNEGDHSFFVRSETEEEIEAYWNSVRKRFTEDYKRKHKDALRWRKKIMNKMGRR